MLVGPKAEALGERVVHDSHVHGSATYISYISEREKALWVWIKAGGWDVELQMGEVFVCWVILSSHRYGTTLWYFSGFTPKASPSPAERVPSYQRSSQIFPVCPVYYNGLLAFYRNRGRSMPLPTCWVPIWWVSLAEILRGDKMMKHHPRLSQAACSVNVVMRRTQKENDTRYMYVWHGLRWSLFYHILSLIAMSVHYLQPFAFVREAVGFL